MNYISSLFCLEYHKFIHKELQELKQEIIGSIETNNIKNETSKNTHFSSSVDQHINNTIYDNLLW